MVSMVSTTETVVSDDVIADAAAKPEVSEEAADTKEENLEEGREPAVDEAQTGRFNFLGWRAAGNQSKGEIAQVPQNPRRNWFRRDNAASLDEDRVNVPDDGSTAPTTDSTVTDESSEPGVIDDDVTPNQRLRWFQRRPQEGEIDANILEKLDEKADANEETAHKKVTGCASIDQGARPNRMWRMFWGQASTVSSGKNLNSALRSDKNSAAPGDPSTSTNLVVRTESVNILWAVVRHSMERNNLWRPMTGSAKRSPTSSDDSPSWRAAADAWRNRFRQRRQAASKEEQGKADSTTEPTSPRTRRWGLFERWNRNMRQQNAGSDSENAGGEDQETTTALVQYEPGNDPVRVVMRKAGAAVGGGCMVLVGIPLLLFPVPGPGVAMIASGVYVISSEFEFARNWLHDIKSRFGPILDHIGIEIGETHPALPPSSRNSDVALPCPSPYGDQVLMLGEADAAEASIEEANAASEEKEIYSVSEEEVVAPTTSETVVIGTAESTETDSIPAEELEAPEEVATLVEETKATPSGDEVANPKDLEVETVIETDLDLGQGSTNVN